MQKVIVAGSILPLVETYKGILSRQEFTVLRAASAEEILAAHEASTADLIIADAEMPMMGGEALCFLLRKKKDLKKVSIIVIADGDELVSAKLLACGANAVVTRPVNIDRLDEKIRKLLNVRERKSMRELVKVSVRVVSEDESFFAVSQDISVSGLLMETGWRLAKGHPIVCSFVLQHQVTVQGEIVRVSERKEKNGSIFEYGVRFTGIDPSVETEIAEYIARTDHEPG
ncbi:MAG: PilZ domain-containing protein [Nitrospiraceae bacterium]|nr:PilZ domain-containing protein [Nitrospiraceae bacterium]